MVCKTFGLICHAANASINGSIGRAIYESSWKSICWNFILAAYSSTIAGEICTELLQRKSTFGMIRALTIKIKSWNGILPESWCISESLISCTSLSRPSSSKVMVSSELRLPAHALKEALRTRCPPAASTWSSGSLSPEADVRLRTTPTIVMYQWPFRHDTRFIPVIKITRKPCTILEWRICYAIAIFCCCHFVR